ncbi:YrdB family protein [Lacticaseibacillus rhamnosus]
MIKSLIDGLRFLVEIATVSLLIWAGWHFPSLVGRLIGGVALPIAVLLAWGRWMAPRSPFQLVEWQRLIAEIVLLAAQRWLLLQSAKPDWHWATEQWYSSACC